VLRFKSRAASLREKSKRFAPQTSLVLVLGIMMLLGFLLAGTSAGDAALDELTTKTT